MLFFFLRGWFLPTAVPCSKNSGYARLTLWISHLSSLMNTLSLSLHNLNIMFFLDEKKFPPTINAASMESLCAMAHTPTARAPMFPNT